MKTKNTKHFELFYSKGSVADKEINFIGKELENNYIDIITKLCLEDNYPTIKYHLYSNLEEKIKETGEDANAHTNRENFEIFSVYTKSIKPIGPHELVHLLSNSLGIPNYVFNEGLAEYFEKNWKGEITGKLYNKSHDIWVEIFVEAGTYISISELFDDRKFWDLDPTGSISYPECGSFMKYLVHEYGIEKVIEAYKKIKRNASNNFDLFEDIFGVSVQQVEEEWLGIICP